ncbi:hypothetical protein D5I55_02005 [Chakrabartia godavariana]|nr:hypothetical protein D5I55_02005 [Chakrabartia godavariana]
MRTSLMTAFIPLILCAATASAADRKEPRPALLQKLVDCRSVTDPAARLACYDAQVAAIDSAESQQELVVVDKAQMKQARKSLFGFSLPKFSLFGNDSDDGDEEMRVLETTVTSARRLADGNWQFKLADGVYWRQMEAKDIFAPKAGDKIKIRKAAMGSYLASINGRTAFRIKREN